MTIKKKTIKQKTKMAIKQKTKMNSSFIDNTPITP